MKIFTDAVVITLSRKRNEYKNLYRTRAARNRIYISALSLLFLCAGLTSCEEEVKTQPFLAGKVINKKNDYVVLQDYEEITDTLSLNETGEFSTALIDYPSKLYTIIHGNELQSIYLQRGDSTRLRFNTKAFDETLAFNGDSQHENNYLINLFIEMETHSKNSMSLYTLEPNAFLSRIDSLKNARLIALNKRGKLKKFKTPFKDIVIQHIEFENWTKRERYAVAHFGKNEIDRSKDLPTNFYAHRDKLDINDAMWLNYFNYRTYINARISQESLIAAAADLSTGQTVNRSGLAYRIKRLEIIDRLFNDSYNKEQFLRRQTSNYIRLSENGEDIKALLNKYNAIAQNSRFKQSIATMAATYVKLDAGQTIPDLTLKNNIGARLNISEQLTDLNMVYFWSSKDEEYALRIHNQVDQLQLKYPELHYIGINIDAPKTKQWLQNLSRYNFDITREFQLIESQDAISAQLAIKNNNRVILLDKDLSIIDPDINPFHYKIETTLLGYISK